MQHARTRMAAQHDTALHDAQACTLQARRCADYLTCALASCVAVAGLSTPPPPAPEGNEAGWRDAVDAVVSAMHSWIKEGTRVRSAAEAQCTVLEDEVMEARRDCESMRGQLTAAVDAQQAAEHQVGTS